MRKFMYVLFVLALVLAFTVPVNAGTNDRFSDIALGDSDVSRNTIIFPEITAPAGNPPTNYGWLYIKDTGGGLSALYFEDDAGTVHSLTPSATAYDDITDPDGASALDFTTHTNTWTSAVITGHSFTIENTGAFNAGEGVMKLEQKTGNPDGGQLLYGTMVDTHVDGIFLYHSLAALTAETVLLKLGLEDDDDANGIYIRCLDDALADTVFQVGQGGDVIISETTTIDENNIFFTAAGEITLGNDSALTLNPGGGDAAGEDLIVTAHNITINAAGAVAIPADAPLATAIDLSDANIIEAIDIGGNAIGGTNFNVSAGGAIVGTALDAGAGLIATTGAITATGNITSLGVITGATLAQDNIVSVTGGAWLGLDGNGAGGVAIATQSGTGTIEVGGGGFGTLMELNQDVNLTLVGGQLSVTDNSDADVVTILNNTITTQDLIDASSASITTGIGMRIDLPAATDATNLYLTNVDATMTATGNYIFAHDGTDDVFSVKRHGAVYIMGDASGTDAVTIDAGDVSLTSGDVDIATGDLLITTNGDIALTRGGIQASSVDDDNSFIKRNQTTTVNPLFELEETHISADQTVFLIDNKITGSAELSMEITSDSAGPTISSTVTSATGDGILFAVPASSTGQLIKADLLAWLGTASEGGIIDIVTTAAGTQEVGQGIRLNYLATASSGAAVLGKGLHVHANAGAQAGESLIYLDTLFNDAIHINNNGVSADGIKFDVLNAYTGQGIVADLGPWLGTTNQGFIHVISDNAATVQAGTFVHLQSLSTGQHAAAIDGSMIYMEDDSTAPGAGTSYGIYMDMTNIEAIHVDTGKVLVDETVTATAGVSAGNSATSFLLTDTIAVTNGQIKNLAAAPKELIATPGGTNYIEVVSIVIVMDYGTNVLTAGGADDLVVQYNTTGIDITASIETTGFLTQAADTAALVPVAGIATVPLASIVNRSVELFNTGAEIAGNVGADTILTVKITYRIHDDGVS